MSGPTYNIEKINTLNFKNVIVVRNNNNRTRNNPYQRPHTAVKSSKGSISEISVSSVNDAKGSTLDFAYIVDEIKNYQMLSDACLIATDEEVPALIKKLPPSVQDAIKDNFPSKALSGEDLHAVMAEKLGEFQQTVSKLIFDGKKEEEKSNSKERSSKGGKPRFYCYKCGQLGHKKDDCNRK